MYVFFFLQRIKRTAIITTNNIHNNFIIICGFHNIKFIILFTFTILKINVFVVIFEYLFFVSSLDMKGSLFNNNCNFFLFWERIAKEFCFISLHGLQNKLLQLSLSQIRHLINNKNKINLILKFVSIFV